MTLYRNYYLFPLSSIISFSIWQMFLGSTRPRRGGDEPEVCRRTKSRISCGDGNRASHRQAQPVRQSLGVSGSAPSCTYLPDRPVQWWKHCGASWAIRGSFKQNVRLVLNSVVADFKAENFAYVHLALQLHNDSNYGGKVWWKVIKYFYCSNFSSGKSRRHSSRINPEAHQSPKTSTPASLSRPDSRGVRQPTLPQPILLRSCSTPLLHNQPCLWVASVLPHTCRPISMESTILQLKTLIHSTLLCRIMIMVIKEFLAVMLKKYFLS